MPRRRGVSPVRGKGGSALSRLPLAMRVRVQIAGGPEGGAEEREGAFSLNNRYSAIYSVYYSAVYRKTALYGLRGPTRKVLWCDSRSMNSWRHVASPPTNCVKEPT